MRDDGFEPKIRMNSISAKTCQQTMVMDFSRLTRFNDDSDPRTKFFFNEMMVDGAGGE